MRFDWLKYKNCFVIGWYGDDTRPLATVSNFKTFENDGYLRCSAVLAGGFRRTHAHTFVAPSVLVLLHHI